VSRGLPLGIAPWYESAFNQYHHPTETHHSLSGKACRVVIFSNFPGTNIHVRYAIELKTAAHHIHSIATPST
jgi:hypothetical protein